MPTDDPETGARQRGLLDGDERARPRLLERHRPRLRRVIAPRLDGRLIARLDLSDIVQDAQADTAASPSAGLIRREVASALAITEGAARVRHLRAWRRIGPLLDLARERALR